jgi:hypothetical protein
MLLGVIVGIYRQSSTLAILMPKCVYLFSYARYIESSSVRPSLCEPISPVPPFPSVQYIFQNHNTRPKQRKKTKASYRHRYNATAAIAARSKASTPFLESDPKPVQEKKKAAERRENIYIQNKMHPLRTSLSIREKWLLAQCLRILVFGLLPPVICAVSEAALTPSFRGCGRRLRQGLHNPV